MQVSLNLMINTIWCSRWKHTITHQQLNLTGGAGTGIGGVIRDSLGTGLGAKPILNTDVFCFGLPDTPYEKLPKGTLHPKRVFNGVVAGVRDYGNRMGIPTANGAILFRLTLYSKSPCLLWQRWPYSQK